MKCILRLLTAMRVVQRQYSPRNALQCKARSCYYMSSVTLSVRPSVRPSVCDVGGQVENLGN